MPNQPPTDPAAPTGADATSTRPVPSGSPFDQLVAIMRVLRSPGGCPWDRKQTLESLRPFVLEETYEVLDAIDRDDRRALRGEIGDMIFEGVFLAQLCEEAGDFTIDAALASVVEKLVRRHPHVFGHQPGADAAGQPAPTLDSPDQVVEQWEQIKAREHDGTGRRPSLLGGIPGTLPALARAFEIGNRTAAVGFDWTGPVEVMEKVREETAEVAQALASGAPTRVEEELGDLLFTVAQLARQLGIEPEAALRKANDKFTRRFEDVQTRLEANGTTLHEASMEAMEREWQRVKGEER